uniref:histone acetyltransferase n=1 Tax=Steinernema glaseri TaxID=37863 RepID=A0A1I7Z7D8_9BILA
MTSAEQSVEQESNLATRNESIQRCIASLEHAVQCKEPECDRAECHKMKRVVTHTRGCRKRQESNCPVCKQLIALFCYHAKECHLEQCRVTFCQSIRRKLEEHKRLVELQDDLTTIEVMEAVINLENLTLEDGSSQEDVEMVEPSTSCS